MWTIKLINGEEVRVNNGLFNRLRTMTDKSIRALGYDPKSVGSAYRREENRLDVLEFLISGGKK